MRIAFLFLIVLFTSNPIYVMAVSSEPAVRFKIMVYPYSESSSGFKYKNFLVFLDSTTSNMIFELLEENRILDVQSSNVQKLESLTAVSIGEFSIDEPQALLSTSQLDRIWVADKQLLEILTGTITANPSGNGSTINSQIYSGFLEQSLRSKRVSLIEDSSEHQTQNFLNSHHMTLLFIIAMYAKQRDEPKWVRVKFLSKAQELSEDVDASQNATVKALKREIIKELKAMKPDIGFPQ